MDGLHMVVKRAAQCRNVYSATLPTVLRLLAVFSKHFSSQSTSVYSARQTDVLHYITAFHCITRVLGGAATRAGGPLSGLSTTRKRVWVSWMHADCGIDTGARAATNSTQ